MKTATKHIFLGGGGSTVDSRPLNERFVTIIDITKPLVYIPNAKQSQLYKSCLAWFESVFSPLGVTKIEMWDNLRPRYSEVSTIAGMYIGGGDTVKLLRELRSTRFVDYLIRVITAGIPVYGGSAGAIILGEDIRTVPEAQELDAIEAKGLQVIPGYSIICHYTSDQRTEVRNLAQKLGQRIIAIPEKAGCHLYDGYLTKYGIGPVSIFREDGIALLNSNQSINILEES